MKPAIGILVVCLLVTILGNEGRSENLLLQASPIDLHSEDAEIDRTGSLLFQGGLNLSSLNSRFGGVSGLAVSADGRRLSAVTDRGDWLRLVPRIGPNGRLQGIADAEIGRLKGRNGKPLRRKRDRDAEAITAYPGGYLIAFEHFHRLRRHQGGRNPLATPAIKYSLPDLARRMPANSGIETLARFPDGRLVAIAEEFPEDGAYLQGWVLGKNQWRQFRYRRYAGFLPTGAAVLPNGNLAVLERRFGIIGGFGSRLVVLSPESIIPGAEVVGREIARLEWPLVTENFEGLAAYRDASGNTILYLVSDDNFLVLQRTLLLKFRLRG